MICKQPSMSCYQVIPIVETNFWECLKYILHFNFWVKLVLRKLLCNNINIYEWIVTYSPLPVRIVIFKVSLDINLYLWTHYLTNFRNKLSFSSMLLLCSTRGPKSSKSTSRDSDILYFSSSAASRCPESQSFKWRWKRRNKLPSTGSQTKNILD